MHVVLDLTSSPTRLFRPPCRTMGGTDASAASPQRRPQSLVTVMGCDRAFSLPAYGALSHVWSESSSPSDPRPLPFPRPQHSVAVIYQSLPLLYAQSLKSKARVDSNCWCASPPPPTPARLPSPLHPICARHPIACDSMRAADLRKEGRSRCTQAVTAVLTNSVRTSAGKVRLFISAKTLQQPGDGAETKHGGGGRGKTKELTWKTKAKQASVWQHNDWASAELSCKRNTSFLPPFLRLCYFTLCYVEASSHAARERAVRESDGGVIERWK